MPVQSGKLVSVLAFPINYLKCVDTLAESNPLESYLNKNHPILHPHKDIQIQKNTD